MPTPSEIAGQMVQSLAISEPDLDTAVGTPVRKILDTVAEAISEAYLDRYLMSYQYDIDSRSGADLDAFVGLFGFYRYPARRASGTLLLQRSTVATQSTVVPSGTQFASSDSPPIVVQTTSAVIFPQNSLSITVPIQAIVGGAAGNLSANSIVRIVSIIDGVGAVSNPASMTGGTDAESDTQLRDRFKRTLFRNLAGTEDMYLGVALNDPDVAMANVVGPAEQWRERIEVVGGTATSTITGLDRGSFTITGATNATPIVVTTQRPHFFRPGDIVKISGVGGNTNANGSWRVKDVGSTTTFSLRLLDDTADRAGNSAYTTGGTVSFVTRARWIYDSGYSFGEDLDNGSILTAGVHYTLDTTVIPPVLTVLDSATVPDGIYDLSFNYAPWASRNDVVKGITNRVDVWTSGSRSLAASETAILDGRSVVSATATNALASARFKRLDGTNPVVGNVILPLAFRPVLGISTALTVGSYTIPTDKYRVVREVPVAYGSFVSVDGIEIDAAELQTGTVNISSSTNATPIVVTVASHNFKNGQRVLVAGHETNTSANGVWTVSSVGPTTFTLTGSAGIGVGGATGTVALYSPVVIGYTYNEIPRSVQAQVEAWRMATTDVVVHHGSQLNLKVYAAVILRPGYSVSNVQSGVDQAVAAFLQTLGFGATVQVSDLLNVIGDVTGIDAVRLLTSDDISAKTVTAASNATPIVITTSTNHGVSQGDLVVIDSVAGNTAANGQWIAQSVTSNQITLRGSVGNGAWTSGGRVLLGNYGIKLMEDDGVSNRMIIAGGDGTPYRTKDIGADDHEYFVLNSVVLTAKATNTFGVA